MSELGLGVEAWGGSSDYGRDAYCKSELNFPNRHGTNAGPFIFQAKFVSGANAAGARFENELLSAISREAQRIKKRIDHKQWKAPRHYGLFTNCPITAAQREKARTRLRKVLSKATLTIHGATGICHLVDLNISAARAFPQLLSLRDLTELLRTVVRNATIQRSDSAIKEAEALTRVFVPTKAYDEAWQVLGKHNFVVLEGQPEMGKTAIAWMIAAVQLTQKWEAIDCDDPKDFFDNYTSSKTQVFVADDAFGTTEYDTTRGDNWGRQMHKILPKLDGRHWLVWTSRMHILKEALQEMSLQGKAVGFPKPAEVVVNAGELSSTERALMLYRHARAAGLEERAKNIVRTNAAAVISNPHFTPERIRRFVNEELPDLSHQASAGALSDNEVSDAIERAIEQPTARMAKAFSKLDGSQKWLLIAMLDSERYPDPETLECSYRRFREIQTPIENEIKLLEEGFLKRVTGLDFPAIDWIHPSYRDLVIDELEKNEASAIYFLERCSATGIQLALSVAGGASGDRRFPLMSSPRSWDVLHNHALELIRENVYDFEVQSLLRTMRTGILTATDDLTALGHLSGMLRECCEEAKVQLDKANQPIEPFLLKEFLNSTVELKPPPPMPSMYVSLEKVQDDFVENLELAEEGTSRLDVSVVEHWARTVCVIAKSDRRLLIQSGFPDTYTSWIEKVCLLTEFEINGELPSGGEESESAISRMSDISGALKELVGVIPKLDNKLRRVFKNVEKRARTLQAKYFWDDGDTEDEAADESRRNQPLDLARLFADL